MLKDLCFEIIQKCPNECVFCSSNANYKKETMIDLKSFKRVIDHFVMLGGIEEVSLSGGEPFLHPDLYEMILYCKSFGIRTVLFTSGVRRNISFDQVEMDFWNRKVEEFYFAKGWPKDVTMRCIQREQELNRRANEREFVSIYRKELEYLKEIGLDKIVFDLQGGCAATYSSLMGRDHFELVMTSIMRTHIMGLETDVHFIPMKENYKEFPEILEMLNIACVDHLSILNFVPQGRGEINRENLMLDDVEMESFREIYLESKDRFEGQIRVGIPLLGEDVHKCLAGMGKLVIKYDGTVLPCPAFKEYDVEKLREVGVRVCNIYENLDEVKVYEGTRVKPLCKRLYAMDRKIN